jgi:hypothetical protein
MWLIQMKNSRPTPPQKKNYFSPKNNLENVFRTFFSVSFAEIYTRKKFQNVFSEFFLPSRGEKETCGVG